MPRRDACVLLVLTSAVAILSPACARRPSPTIAAGSEPSAAPSPDPVATASRECPPREAAACESSVPPAVPPSTHDLTRVLRGANTPPELVERGAAAHVWEDHEIDGSINPFYLRGDFDGDGRPDYLVSVLRKGVTESPPTPRLLVLRGIAGESAAVWLEDDARLSLPARDGWYVHARRTKVPVGFDGSKPPRLVGDAIVMMKAESSSALVYWTGTRFASHWLSD